LALALRELGRLERSLFTLDWLEDPAFRRQAGRELNKGEARNSLARAVFIHRLGEIRDRTYENQQHRASGLNLVVGAIMLWNTRYLEHAIATLRKTTPIADDLLAHLSPLGWEHINLTGDYLWTPSPSENKGGLRPLRIMPSDLRQAA
jgi:TnpA family transposase